MILGTAATAPADEKKIGVGLQVVPTSRGELVVLAVVAGSSAANAGLLPGDLIVSVAGKTLEGRAFEDVARRLLWGEEGSSVEMVILRPGEAGKKNLFLQRTKLKGRVEAPIGVQMIVPGEE